MQLKIYKQWCLGNTTDASSVDFFDNSFTNSKNRSNVTCCHPDNTFEVATCGQGASCAGACSALDASLCPSGTCTDDPGTCEIDFRSEQSGGSTATLSGSDLKWCISDRCRVRIHPECCYNPNCLTEEWTGRAEACGWLDYLTGMNNADNNRFEDIGTNFLFDTFIEKTGVGLEFTLKWR